LGDIGALADLKAKMGGDDASAEPSAE